MINFGPVEPSILIGNAPQTAIDVSRLKQMGVTAVLSLQSDDDLRGYRIDEKALLSTFQQHDISHHRYPIVDFDEVDLGNKVAQPAIALNDLLDSGHRVYVHCNAGICRAPGTVLTYLCHFRSMTMQQGLEHIRVARPQANPYLRAVQKGLANLASLNTT